MADAAPLVAALCKCFGAEVGHAANLEDRLEKLSEQRGELEHLKRDIQKDFDQAPMADREPTEVAKNWVKRADSIIGRARAMEKAEEKKRNHKQAGGGRRCCAHSWSRYKLGRSIAKVTKKVSRHLEKGKQLKILRDLPPDSAASKGKATEDVSATTSL